MANIRHQKPRLEAEITTLFQLYTTHAVINAKILKEAFGISSNTALRAIRLCINDAKEKGTYYPSNPNEISTINFFNFYGWDISHIESAYKMKHLQ